MNKIWIGVERGECKPTIDRLTKINEELPVFQKIQINKNTLFTDPNLKKRAKHGHSFTAYQISKSQIKRALGKNSEKETEI